MMLQGRKGVTNKGCRVSTGWRKRRPALGVVTGRGGGLYDGDKPPRGVAELWEGARSALDLFASYYHILLFIFVQGFMS